MYLVNGKHLLNHLPELGPNDSHVEVDLLGLIGQLPDAELRRLYAAIGGKLGKRKITPEQQMKMQEARRKIKPTLYVKHPGDTYSPA